MGLPAAVARSRRRGECIIAPSPVPVRTSMRILIVPLIAACLTAGCGIVYKQPVYQGNLVSGSNVEQLQAGMSRQQVLALLGTPSIQDPFHHDRWDYTASQRLGRGGDT